MKSASKPPSWPPPPCGAASALPRNVLLAFSLLLLAGCGGEPAEGAAPAATEHAPVGAVGMRLRPVPGVPQIAAGPVDAEGRQARVSCSTCHSLKPPVPGQQGGDTLKTFHQGLQVAHGSLTCLSCHNAEDYDALRLANGERVSFERVRDLCAQCHGPQARAYAHGAHGGMSGFWDKTRGEQVRNQCTHCHAPHAPAFPHMQPTFKPRDRFLLPHASALKEPHDD
jgi:hypothetical protein